MVVLDSDILVGFLRGDKEALYSMENIVKTGEKINTTVINMFEILAGAFLSSNADENSKKIENLVQAFGVFALNQFASKIAAEISAELTKKGKIIDFQDIAIAAIAISNNEKIVTRNIKHFSRIKGLKMEKW